MRITFKLDQFEVSGHLSERSIKRIKVMIDPACTLKVYLEITPTNCLPIGQNTALLLILKTSPALHQAVMDQCFDLGDVLDRVGLC